MILQPHHTLYLTRHPLLAGLSALAMISFVLMSTYYYTRWLAIILHGIAALVVTCICTAVPVLMIGIQLAIHHSDCIRVKHDDKTKDERKSKERLLGKKNQ